MADLKNLYNVTDEHYGLFPASTNPYMRGTLISKKVVQDCLKELKGVAVCYVVISPTRKWAVSTSCFSIHKLIIKVAGQCVIA